MSDNKRRVLREVEALQREADRAEGAYRQLLKRLKKEFGVDSIEEAEKLLEKKEKELARMEAKFEQDYSEFEQKWSPYLEGLDHD